MRKDYDFDDEWEGQSGHQEKARILVTVIPFVLIIIILAVTLLVSASKNKKTQGGKEDLQESIMDYADSNLPKDTEESDAFSTAAPADNQAEAAGRPEETANPEAESTPTPYKEIMEAGKKDYSKVEFNKEEQLKEMMTYWADNNQQALDDLANLERFIAMSYKLSGTKDFYYYGDTNGSGQPNGTGIAVYADNQYYYGGWENGVRSGNGTWIHYHIHETESKTDLYTYHQYTGSWKNDLPDGEGSEHYDYNLHLLKENVGYNTNLIGSYQAGLINGEFYITNIYSNNDMREWYATAENGSWVYQNDNVDKKGRRPVQVEDRDSENFIWLHPKDNKNIGVPCLISKYKN